MSKKEIARLLDHIEPQGVNVTRTTKGLLLRLPDQTTAMLHFTGSDVREPKNVRARLRRAGVTWPGDETELPDYITSGNPPSRHTLERVQAALEGWDQRYVNGAQLRRLLEERGDKSINVMTAQRALYALGWVPTGKRTARKWLRPLELEPEPVEAQPDNVTPLEPAEPVELRPAIKEWGEPPAAAAQHVTAARVEHPAPLQLVPDTPPVRSHPGGREFIDTHDSWVADPAALPEGLTVQQLQQVLRAFGLDGEFRVWRTSGS